MTVEETPRNDYKAVTAREFRQTGRPKQSLDRHARLQLARDDRGCARDDIFPDTKNPSDPPVGGHRRG